MLCLNLSTPLSPSMPPSPPPTTPASPSPPTASSPSPSSSTPRSGTCWHLSWSGSASNSPAIEVDKNLAEYILLPDRTSVRVKTVSNLPRAILVTIEPDNEDDWEILELNVELAKEAILKQMFSSATCCWN